MTNVKNCDIINYIKLYTLEETVMRKFALCILLIISISLSGCNLFIGQEEYDEIYEEGYKEGYFEGRIEGESNKLNDDFFLLWAHTYVNNGKDLRNNEKCKIGHAIIRLRTEEIGNHGCLLNIDFKLSNVDDMSIWNDVEDIDELFPITCWSCNEFSSVDDNELFVNNYTFTDDGYLSDQIILTYGSEPVPMILFVSGQVMAIEFDPFS